MVRIAILMVLVCLAATAEDAAGAVEATEAEAGPPTTAVAAPAPTPRTDGLQPQADWLREVRAEPALDESTAQERSAAHLKARAHEESERRQPAWWLLGLVLIPFAWYGLHRALARRPADGPRDETGRIAYSEKGTGYFVLDRAGEGSGARAAAGAGSGTRRVGTGLVPRESGQGSGSRAATGAGSGTRRVGTGLVRRPPSAGFSLLEVMIVVAILATGLAFMVGQIYTLNKAAQATREMAKVQELAQVMAERLQGAAWTRLGTVVEPWSWHRRDDPAAVNPPMTETATDANSNLLALGLLQGPSALADLRVHVEYYRNTVLLGTDSRPAWNVNRAVPFNRLPEPPALFDLRDELNDIVIRIVIRWQANDGGPRTHELALTRRQ